MAVRHEDLISNRNRLIDENEASKWSGYSMPWFRKKRLEGGGPPFIKVGRAVRYKLGTLLDWFEKHTVNNTSDVGGVAKP